MNDKEIMNRLKSIDANMHNIGCGVFLCVLLLLIMTFKSCG